MAVTINASTSAGLQLSSDTSGEIGLQNNGTTALTIDSNSNVGIGTTSPTAKLGIEGSITCQSNTAYSPQFTAVSYSNDATGPYFNLNKKRAASGASAAVQVNDPLGTFVFAGHDSNGVYQNSAFVGCKCSDVGAGFVSGFLQLYTYGSTSYIQFLPNGTEQARIDSTGNFLFGQSTSTDPGGGNVIGTAIQPTGLFSITKDSNNCAKFNRKTNDGAIITLHQDGTAEGTISVSGTSITYGTFCGAHWSQLTDNSRPDILRGTIVETIDEKCTWDGEGNDQLAKFKISDTVESKRVYGVFMAWDNDDLINNDSYIASLGAYIVRIASGVTVQGGDLLQSNGDGCAKVQSDDIIRSSTIGKVTCNIPLETYPDGSYLVPCVLYCG